MTSPFFYASTPHSRVLCLIFIWDIFVIRPEDCKIGYQSRLQLIRQKTHLTCQFCFGDEYLINLPPGRHIKHNYKSWKVVILGVISYSYNWKLWTRDSCFVVKRGCSRITLYLVMQIHERIVQFDVQVWNLAGLSEVEPLLILLLLTYRC